MHLSPKFCIYKKTWCFVFCQQIICNGSNRMRRRSSSELSDGELHTSNSSASLLTPVPVSCCCVKNYSHHVQHEIRLRLQLLFFNEFFWLHCKRIQQLVLCYIPDNVTTQRVFDVLNSVSELKS